MQRWQLPVQRMKKKKKKFKSVPKIPDEPCDFCNKPVGLNDWVINAAEKLLHYPDCFRQNLNSITLSGGKNGNRNRSVYSSKKSHYK